MFLFINGTHVTESNRSHQLTKQMASTLLSTYRDRIDNIIKVGHWPSVIAVIEKKNSELQSEGQWTRVHALECAIHFAALCTMTDTECEQQLNCKRFQLIQELRIAAESSISEAKLLKYPDLTVLQAFVIYLVGRTT